MFSADFLAEIVLNAVYEDREGIEYLALHKAYDSETKEPVIVYRPVLSSHESFICTEAEFRNSFAYLRPVSDAETMEYVNIYPTSEATEGVVIGGIYTHFKGMKYKVLHLATNVATGETMVVYEAQYDDNKVWVRPLTMFAEKVTRDGKTFDRFKLDTL